jgi:hypothetical protein
MKAAACAALGFVTLQPVLDKETGTQLLYYREIWSRAAGTMCILSAVIRSDRCSATLRSVKRLLGHSEAQSTRCHDYLSWDVLRPSRRDINDPIRVTPSERQRLAPSWFQRGRYDKAATEPHRNERA